MSENETMRNGRINYEWGIRPRFSLGDAMALVLISACVFATWQSTRFYEVRPNAWLSWSDHAKRDIPALTPQILARAKATPGLQVGTELDEGLRLEPIRSSSLFKLERGTGDMVEDTDVVNAIANAMIDTHPPGELVIIARAKSASASVQKSILVKRFWLSALVGVGSLSGLLGIRRLRRHLANRRSHFRRLTLLVAGASYDSSR